MIDRLARALATVLLGPALLVVGACSDDPLTGLMRNCEAPGGTSPFTFDAGGRRLSGFVDVPDGPGPHPAVMLIHGEGPTDVMRGVGDYARLRDAFREAGVASVVWDKAGSGCSTGRYRGIADLYLRSDEIVAAVDALRAAPGRLDPERIGAWAIGQGGWVAPMAAVRTDGLSYLIVVGGPGQDPVQQRLFLVRRNLELEGYPRQEVDAVVERLGGALDAMAGQASYRDYVALIEPVAGHPFMEQLMDLTSDIFPDARRYDEIRSSGSLDVSAEVFLAALEVPVLAIWGTLDSRVDWREAARAYQRAFEPRSEADLTVRAFEGANHALCEAETGSLAESRASACRLVDGYVDTMVDWLRTRGFAPGGPPARPAESALTNAADNAGL